MDRKKTAAREGETTRLREKITALERRAREARILQKAVMMAAVTQSFDQALARCIRMICQATNWPVGHAYLPAQDGSGELVPSNIWYWRGNVEQRNLRIVTERTRFAKGIGLPGRILASSKPAWIPDVYRDSNFLRSRYKLPLGVTGAFGFPILFEGRVAAVLEFFSRETRPPDQNLIDLMAGLGIQVGRVLERFRASERLRQAEAEMRDLSRRLIEVQEDERRRVARDLHDGVIQVLSSVKFALSAAAEKMSGNVSADFTRGLALVDEGVRELRAITRSLRPSMLEHLGLEAALRALCADHEALVGMPIRFAGTSSANRLPPNAELTLYRIAQEALANAIKHAKAERCDVRIRRTRGAVHLIIEDDGRGFDTVSADVRHGGLGLVNIRERAAFAGGTAEIASSASSGTRIAIRIPLGMRVPAPPKRKARNGKQ